MPGHGSAPVNFCLIGQSVLQLETAPHMFRGMWNQSNSIVDVKYLPPHMPRQPLPGDEDYEDGLTILYRLGKCQGGLSHRHPIVCVACTCDKSSQPEVHTPTVDETAETSEQDGLRLDQLLRAFALYEKKPANKRSIVVLRNLILSYRGNDTVNPEQLKRLDKLLNHEDVALRGVCLLTIHQLCRLDSNVVTFLIHDTLDTLLSLLQCHSSRPLHRHVTAVIEQMVTSEVNARLWLTTMVETGLATILLRLRTSMDEATMCGCACVLRTLARHTFFVPYIRSTAVDEINSLKSKHGRLRELYVEIFGELLCHRDETDIASVLDPGIFPTLRDILVHSQCHLQKQVLLMLVSLTRTEGCLSVLRARVLPCILSLWLDSYCMRVRECAVFALCQLLSSRSKSMRLEVLKEIGYFFDSDDDHCMYQHLVSGNSRVMRKMLKLERSLQDFTLSLVASIRREARIERDRQGNIIKVHLHPGKQSDHPRINMLCHLVVILGIMTQLRVDHNMSGKRLTNRPESLIGWTMLIQTVKEAYRKNTAARLGVASQRYLGGAMSPTSTQSRERHDSIDLTSIFELEEVNLIVAILGVIHLWVSCSTEDATRCLCLFAKESVPAEDQCDISIQCTSANLKVDNETKTHSEQSESTERANRVVTESNETDSTHKIRKKTLKILKSTTETMYQEICGELRGQLRLNTLSDSDHKYGHCCFCDDEDVTTPSPDMVVDEVDCTDDDLRQMRLLQRDVRVSLYEAGVLESVGPWLACTNITIKRTVLDILGHMVQPLDDIVEQQNTTPEDKKSSQHSDTKANEEQEKESDELLKETSATEEEGKHTNEERQKELLTGVSTRDGEEDNMEEKEHKEEAEETRQSNKEDKEDAEDSNEDVHHSDTPGGDGINVQGSDIEEVHIEICDVLEDSTGEHTSSRADSDGQVKVAVDHIYDDPLERKTTSTSDSQDKHTDDAYESRQNYDKHGNAVRAMIESRSKTFSSTHYDQFARSKKERCQSASAIIRVRPSSGRPYARPSSGKTATSSRPATGWPSDNQRPGQPCSGHRLHRPSSAPKSIRQIQHVIQRQNGETKEAPPDLETDQFHKPNTSKENGIMNDEIFQKKTEWRETSPTGNVEIEELTPKEYEVKKETLDNRTVSKKETFPKENLKKKIAFIEPDGVKKEVSSKQNDDTKDLFLIQHMEKRGSRPKQRLEKIETLPRRNTVKKDRTAAHSKREKLVTSAVGKPQLIVHDVQDKELHKMKENKHRPVTAPKNLSYSKLRSPRRLSIEKTNIQQDLCGGCKQPQLAPPLKQPGISRSWKPPFNPSQSPVAQCHTRLVDICGKAMLHELFSKERSVKIDMLCLLYQLAVHSQVHMLMSEKGVIHKLVDFLRVNDQDEQLQRMGLLLVQELFRHERRLNQLFCKLGGAPLLESMLSQGNVGLRPVVVETLNMLSGEGTPPVVRMRHSSGTVIPDIWDQITERWLMEDKISQMLKTKLQNDTVPADVS